MGAVGLEPGVQFHQRFRSEAVQPPLGIAADLHQTGVTQHLEMSRDTRLMHPDQLDKVVDRAFAVPDRIEDAPPGRFGDRDEDIASSGHPLKVRQSIYMRKRIYRRFCVRP